VCKNTLVISITLIRSFIGLYNGALGTVVGFGFRKRVPPEIRIPSDNDLGADLKRKIPVIFVQMDEDNGISISTSKEAVIPFTMIESLAKLNHGGVKYIRYQLPLTPAHCQTIHSSQGLTAKSDLVIEPSPSTPFEMPLEYVAISRVTRLYLLDCLGKD
jgi:ATP-dependent exoDNAse (exonuclease V) alpha subunit